MGRSLRYRGGLSFWCYKNQQLRRHKSEVVNGQRIKHYISGNPINVETNIIETTIVGDIPHGTTRPDLALHRWPAGGLTTHEPDDSWMAPMAGQIEDKAQRAGSRLWWAGLRTKGWWIFPLRGSKTRTCIQLVRKDRLVLVLLGLHM